MSAHLSSASTLRRLAAVGLAALGLATAAATSAPPGAHAAATSAPPRAHAAVRSPVQTALLLTSCPVMMNAYMNRDISTMTPYQRQRTGFCLINAARQKYGAPALGNQPQLVAVALAHAQLSARLAYWTTWQSSHIEPSQAQAGLGVNDAIKQRIANSGFCQGGSLTPNEITFTAWGTGGAYPPTLRGAVRWWLSDPPHRAVLLDPTLKHVGFGAVPGDSQSTDSPGNAPTGTFVADFGSCNGN
jgi:uncharacterized protein YkwD